MNNYENRWESIFNAVMNMKTPDTDTQLKSAEVVFKELDRVYNVLSCKFKESHAKYSAESAMLQLSVNPMSDRLERVTNWTSEYQSKITKLESDFEKAYQHYYTILAGGETNE